MGLYFKPVVDVTVLFVQSFREDYLDRRCKERTYSTKEEYS